MNMPGFPMSDVHKGHDHVTQGRERLVDTASLLIMRGRKEGGGRGHLVSCPGSETTKRCG